MSTSGRHDREKLLRLVKKERWRFNQRPAVHAIADRTCSMADRAVKIYRFEKEFDAVQDVFELQVCSLRLPHIV